MKYPGDSLHHQNRRNAVIFLAFAMLGGVAMLFLKNRLGVLELEERVFGWETATIIGFPVLLMIIYALMASYVRTFRLRRDQTGDNLYYLGFIYTLCSLSVALWNVAHGAEAISILRSFGIAITSTLVGVTLRVFFQQMRVDPYDVEEAARVELADATSRVRRELDDTVIQLEDFRRSAVQAMSEGFGETQQSVDKITKDILKSFEAIGQSGGKAVEGASRELVTTLGNVDVGVRTFANQVGAVGQMIEGLAEAGRDAQASFVDLSALQRESAETNKILYAELNSLVTELKRHLHFQRSTVEASQVSIRNVGELVAKHLEVSQTAGEENRKLGAQLNSVVREQLRIQQAAADASQAELRSLGELIKTHLEISRDTGEVNRILCSELQSLARDHVQAQQFAADALRDELRNFNEANKVRQRQHDAPSAATRDLAQSPSNFQTRPGLQEASPEVSPGITRERPDVGVRPEIKPVKDTLTASALDNDEDGNQNERKDGFWKVLWKFGR